MTRLGLSIKWLLWLLCLLMLGSTGYLFFLALNANLEDYNFEPGGSAPVGKKLFDSKAPAHAGSNPASVPEEISGPPDLHKKAFHSGFLKNPFVSPLPSDKELRRGKDFLEYQGVIETADTLLGLVEVTKTHKTLIVHQGQKIDSLGVEILTITAKSLTFSKDGVKTVISLGGIRHEP